MTETDLNDAIATVRRLAADQDGCVAISDYLDVRRGPSPHLPGTAALYSRFGSWADFLRVAGVVTPARVLGAIFSAGPRSRLSALAA
jgi:hypothetical protein